MKYPATACQLANDVSIFLGAFAATDTFLNFLSGGAECFRERKREELKKQTRQNADNQEIPRRMAPGDCSQA